MPVMDIKMDIKSHSNSSHGSSSDGDGDGDEELPFCKYDVKHTKTYHGTPQHTTAHTLVSPIRCARVELLYGIDTAIAVAVAATVADALDLFFCFFLCYY